MRRVALGHTDIEISAQGLGCMGMAGWYGVRDDTEARATIARSVSISLIPPMSTVVAKMNALSAPSCALAAMTS